MRVYLFLFLSLYTLCLPAQKKALTAFDSLSVTKQFKADVNALCADSFKGRPAGTIYENRAAFYLVKRFREEGLVSDTTGFTIRISEDSIAVSYNVLGFLDNKTDSTIVIGAHYDHLGNGEGKSREVMRKGIHPGADDNASGVTMMLELAHYLKEKGSKKYNYLFIGLAAHETGLFGSYNFTRSALFKLLHIKCYLNFDMVGRLDVVAHRVRLTYSDSAKSEAMAFEHNNSAAITFVPVVDENLLNDYSLFSEHCVPSLNITTGLHDDYHKMSDTPDKLNYSGMFSLYEAILSTLYAL